VTSGPSDESLATELGTELATHFQSATELWATKACSAPSAPLETGVEWLDVRIREVTEMLAVLGQVQALGSDGRRGLTGSVQAYSHWLNGNTLHIENANYSSPLLARVCNAVERELGGSTRFRANVYLSPGGSNPATPVHLDPTPAIIVQLSGTKEWAIHWSDAPPLWQDRASAFVRSHAEVACSTADELRTLSQGDWMAIPAQGAHAARTVGASPSIHIALRAFEVPATYALAVQAQTESAMEPPLPFLSCLLVETQWVRRGIAPLLIGSDHVAVHGILLRVPPDLRAVLEAGTSIRLDQLASSDGVSRDLVQVLLQLGVLEYCCQ
jgi:hypothetical protein